MNQLIRIICETYGELTILPLIWEIGLINSDPLHGRSLLFSPSPFHALC